MADRLIDLASLGSQQAGESPQLSRRTLMGTPLAGGLQVMGLAALFSAVANGASADPAGSAAPGPALGMPNPRVFRMYDGKDGKTHFRQEKFEPISGGLQKVKVDSKSEHVLPKTDGELSHFFSEYAQVTIIAAPPFEKPTTFHWATRLGLSYIIQGHWALTMTDGTTMHLQPGDFYWVGDNSEKCGGHSIQVMGPEWGLEIAMFLDHKADPI
jgi:hypothetical protein